MTPLYFPPVLTIHFDTSVSCFFGASLGGAIPFSIPFSLGAPMYHIVITLSLD